MTARATGHSGWEDVGKRDVQKWIVRLLDRYSSSYASNEYHAPFPIAGQSRKRRGTTPLVVKRFKVPVWTRC